MQNCMHVCMGQNLKHGVVGIEAHIGEALPRSEADVVAEQIVEVPIMRVTTWKGPENAMEK